MLTALACIATFIGVAFIYVTNKNQRVLHSPLSKHFRLVSYLGFFLGLVTWYQILTPASALFMWLMTSMLFFILTPLFTLLTIRK